MATPNTSKHNSSAQAVATPPVSTPFSASNHASHPAFSPHGPRSVVPSPQQVKKSPANSNTMFGYPGGGGHPTTSSFGVGYDSPSAAMALGGGMEMLEGMGTPLNNMGHLAVVGAHSARGDEEERARKLAALKDILKTSQGRISEKGIQHLASRLGLESITEDIEIGSRSSSQSVIIAGHAISVDLIFENNLVKTVLLQFPTSPPIVNRHVDKANEILLRDLKIQENESVLLKKLDGFANNLEKLAVQDQLSQANKPLNCFEAVGGIYEALAKLHKWDVEKLTGTEEMAGKSKEFIERTAMCTRSGRPTMHARNRLGLSLDYWQEKGRLGSQNDSSKTWALLIECTKKQPFSRYQPARVSEHWISDHIEKVNPPAEDLLLAAADGPMLDWLEPENTFVPPQDPPEPLSMEVESVDQLTGLRRPAVVFVAKFIPPLVVSSSIAATLYHIVGLEFTQPQPMVSFDDLILPRPAGEKFDEPRMLKREVTVPAFGKDGEKTAEIHKNNLIVEGFEPGATLTELLFSHPKQLVEMLPYLRQYALTSTLLEKSFGASSKPPSTNTKDTAISSVKDDFNAFMAGTVKKEVKRLDIKLATGPKFRITFPCIKAISVGCIFEIAPNGVVKVENENMLGKDQSSGRKPLTREDLGKMLEITEDFGIFREYVERRLSL